jgi:hypothetical protein
MVNDHHDDDRDPQHVKGHQPPRPIGGNGRGLPDTGDVSDTMSLYRRHPDRPASINDADPFHHASIGSAGARG